MNQISFVVQGPVVSLSSPPMGTYSTQEVLYSIRQHYPAAEIILSTWQGSDVSGLIYDQLVLSEDPGGFKLGGLTMNYNRLILSAKEGIRRAKHSYVVKTRTDILFTGNQLYHLLEQIKPIKGAHNVFDNYVLSTIWYVRNPIRLNLVFHPSDIFLVGKKDDVLSHFDAPLQPRGYYFNDNDTTKIVSEQYFFVHNISRKQKVQYDIPKWGYTNLRFFWASERFLFSNFKFYGLEEMGITFPERLFSVYRPKSNYTLKQAKLLSKVYAENLAYGKAIIFARGVIYFIYHYLLYYPKILWHHGVKPVLNRTTQLLTT